MNEDHQQIKVRTFFPSLPPSLILSIYPSISYSCIFMETGRDWDWQWPSRRKINQTMPRSSEACRVWGKHAIFHLCPCIISLSKMNRRFEDSTAYSEGYLGERSCCGFAFTLVFAAGYKSLLSKQLPFNNYWAIHHQKYGTWDSKATFILVWNLKNCLQCHYFLALKYLF